MRSFQRLQSSLRYSFLPRLIDALIALSTVPARSRLAQKNLTRILIDSSVIGHGVTHESTWVSTGTELWGGEVELETGYLARVPIHDPRKNNELLSSVQYLPGLVDLTKRGLLELWTSPELLDERLSQPSGRYSGYSLYSYSLFRSIKLHTVRDPDYSVTISGHQDLLPTVEDQRSRRLAGRQDPLFVSLVNALGAKSTQDAFHIATAERNGIPVFLTMDFRLLKNLQAQRRNSAISSLRTRVLSPEQFGREVGLPPIPPILLSYHEASFPVETSSHLGGERRRKTKR
ncbi:MAG: hypothetical protein AAF922_06290 [Pseudomonadota bacterium]